MCEANVWEGSFLAPVSRDAEADYQNDSSWSE